MTQNEIKSRLNKIQKEVYRRFGNKNLLKYNTGEKIHKKQLLFHKDNHKNRWVFGGNRSGKTECGAVEAIWIARGIHPYRKITGDTEGWVVSLSTQVQRDVAQKKILHYLNKDWIEDIIMSTGKKTACEYGVIDTIIIRNVFGGLSKIGFKSCDQGREKFQGTSLDYVWFDEEPPFDIYMECKMRVVDKCGILFGTMTPLKGLTWVYEHIYLNNFNDPDVWYVQMEWEDNPFLDKREIESLTKAMSKEELETRRFGNFGGFGGRVYGEFDESVHVIDPFDVPISWYDNISIDPGLNNPLSCHWYAVDFDGNVYVIAEHFEAEKDIVYHANKIKDVCKKLNWPTSYSGKIEALIDSAANQKTLASIKSVTELFYEQDILVNTNVNKDLFSGINKVKQYLKSADGKIRLYIFRTCTNLIRELKSYYWGNNDVPIKSDDHALDELRYYIMSKPDTPQITIKKTDIQKDKERLLRRLRRRC
ncbi:MAG: terminase family protein [Clostridia bacterium]|nr:terminase family protein [Clostridia bacterium]